MADKHLDPDVLSALREVMEDEYPKLLDTFLADSEARLNLLHATEDTAQLIEAAHSLKGSSGNLGANRLAELCSQLEYNANSMPPQSIKKLIAEIDDEFLIVRPLYKAERQRSLTER